MLLRWIAPLALTCFVSLACGTDTDHPPLLAAGPASPTRGSVAVDAGSDAATVTNDGGPGTLAVTDGGTCAAIAPTTLITQQQVALAAPKPTGGVLTPGTYDLTKMTKYTGVGGAVGPTTRIQAQAMALDASTYQRATSDASADGGLTPPALESGNYTLSDITFTVHATCGVGNVPISYSASPTTIALLFINEEFTFTRR